MWISLMIDCKLFYFLHHKLCSLELYCWRLFQCSLTEISRGVLSMTVKLLFSETKWESPWISAFLFEFLNYNIIYVLILHPYHFHSHVKRYKYYHLTENNKRWSYKLTLWVSSIFFVVFFWNLTWDKIFTRQFISILIILSIYDR